jgi:hypothetical protein
LSYSYHIAIVIFSDIINDGEKIMLTVTDLAIEKVKSVLGQPENKNQFVRVYFDGIG